MNYSVRLPLDIAYPQSPLACDLAADDPGARALFACHDGDLDRLAGRRLRERRGSDEASRTVERFNQAIGADPAAMRNASKLAHGEALCVITGQQVGFLGGPAYSAYKIVTALRLASELTSRLGVAVVPAFWMATQDHDLGEVSRCHALGADGEITAVRFDWDGGGRPIAALPLTPEVRSAYEQYLQVAFAPGQRARIAALTEAGPDDDYCLWHARILARLFSSRGLVVVDPSRLDTPSRPFYERVCASPDGIRVALEAGGDAVASAGYPLPLPLDRAGRLFVEKGNGRRTRLSAADRAACARIRSGDWRASPDAALRPLLADSLLPVIADVLGPGEIAYHALLSPLYRLFDVPQPVPVPRLSCTLVTPSEHDLMIAACATPETVVGGR
ncbi:MAG: bacillithiol biosynthesis BshC, partial [Candidatus Bipolaricaulota bacterium]